jgi:hypothetical protein
MRFWNRLFGRKETAGITLDLAGSTVKQGRKTEKAQPLAENQQAESDRPATSKIEQFKSCPNCGKTSSPYGADLDMNIFRCSCGRVYCNNCSAGGLVACPRCPSSPYHEGIKKVGVVPPQARQEQQPEDKTKELVRSLHNAAQEGDVLKIQEILNQGVNPNSTRDRTEVVDYAITITPLYWAAEHGHREAVNLLLTHGANVNSHCGVSRTPLYMAVMNGHTEVAQLLLEHGANVNARAADGFTPLGRALGLQRRLPKFHELVTLLREKGGKE